MIEEGLVLLIQAGLARLTPYVPGGFAVQLPKDQITPDAPMAWTWRSILSEPSYYLDGQDGLTSWEVQFDCHGQTMAQAMTLARAIDGALRGIYRGTLPDADHTVVQSITRQEPFIDGFSDANRTYVRSLEYRIDYQQI